MTEEKQTLEIEVRTVDLEGKGFWPKYRNIIQMKEAFMNPIEATIKDLDAAQKFLLDHIVTPEKEEEKLELLEDMDADEFMQLFERISGGAQTAVPPTNGGDSADTSE